MCTLPCWEIGFCSSSWKAGLPALLKFSEKVYDVGIYGAESEIFLSCLRNWEHRLSHVFSKWFMHGNSCYLLNHILGIWNFYKEVVRKINKATKLLLLLVYLFYDTGSLVAAVFLPYHFKEFLNAGDKEMVESVRYLAQELEKWVQIPRVPESQEWQHNSRLRELAQRFHRMRCFWSVCHHYFLQWHFPIHTWVMGGGRERWWHFPQGEKWRSRRALPWRPPLRSEIWGQSKEACSQLAVRTSVVRLTHLGKGSQRKSGLHQICLWEYLEHFLSC